MTKGLITIALITLLGCATTDTNDFSKVLAMARLSAYLGTAESILSHPEWKPDFVLARDELKILETSDTVDLATLLAIMNRLPVKELKGEQTKIVITTFSLILQDAVFNIYPLEKTGSLQRVARALRQGIDIGLGGTL